MKVDSAHEAVPDGSGLAVAVVTATFNESITGGLREGALAFLSEAGVPVITDVTAPGAFELPLYAQRLAGLGYDAVVCLGAVIEGDTDHYEHVATRSSEGLMRVQLDSNVPIAFGILTVRDVQHAIDRSQPGPDNKGREAAAAAVTAALDLAKLNPPSR